jgi:hypothetical protein
MRRKSPRLQLGLQLEPDTTPQTNPQPPQPAPTPTATVCLYCRTYIRIGCPNCARPLTDEFTRYVCHSCRLPFTEADVTKLQIVEAVCDRCQCKNVGGQNLPAHVAALDGAGKFQTKKHAHKTAPEGDPA